MLSFLLASAGINMPPPPLILMIFFRGFLFSIENMNLEMKFYIASLEHCLTRVAFFLIFFLILIYFIIIYYQLVLKLL